MLKISSSIQKDLDKRNTKEIRVYANEQTPIEILEEALNTMKRDSKKLELEIITDEGTYGAVAKDKIDRKLKTGIDAKTANAHQSQITTAMSKRDSKIENLESKIEVIEKNEYALKEETQRKIDSLNSKLENQLVITQSKIKKLQSDIEVTRTETDNTIAHFQPLLDRCYETVPIVTVYPPSHFKKQEVLKQLQSSIKSAEHNILVMKAASYNDIKIDQQEEELKRRRILARQESAEELRKADEAQHREDCRLAELKKDAYRAEERARRERQQERDDILANMEPDEPLVYPPPRKFRNL